jgi:glycosyltransferase involved in cell wall biosynthesis
MKILCLCKRRPMGRDLMTRPYGRFYYLPFFLAAMGHEVIVVLASYEHDSPTDFFADGVRWISVPGVVSRPISYVGKLVNICAWFRPDSVIGFSDIYYGVLAVLLSKRFSAYSVIDAYDNYESYIEWAYPLHVVWRWALAAADLVSAAGPQLLDLLTKHRSHKKGIVVPMAADPIFSELDRMECKTYFGFLDKKIIGYCGSIFKNRGLDVLFEAVLLLRQERTDFDFVLSGRLGSGVRLPKYAHYMGVLDDPKVPVLINALDVLTVINRRSRFGEFSYPVKLYEAMACGISAVASHTGPAGWILRDQDRHLAKIGDPDDLALKMNVLLDLPPPRGGVADIAWGWEKSADVLRTALMER